MGKIKDLVTDVDFVLQSTDVAKEVMIATPKRTKIHKVDIYTYKCESNGAVVSFYAHPTRAWNWAIDLAVTNPLGEVVASALIDAFVQAGLERGEKSFMDAIKVIHLG